MSSSIRYLLRESILILTLPFLMVVASTQNGLLTPQILTITAVFLTVLAIVYAVFLRKQAGPLVLPAVVFTAVLFLTALTGVDPRRSLAEAWLIGIPFCLAFVVAALVRRGWPGELVLKAVLIAGVIIMALAWIDPIVWYLRWLKASGGHWLPAISYRLPVPNFMGVILNLLLMVAAARLTATRVAAARVILGVYVLSDLALLYLSSSRGAWVGTAAGLFVLFLLHLRAYRTAFARAWAFLKSKRILLAGLAVAVLAFGALAGYMLIRQTRNPTHVPIANARGYLWHPALQGFLDSPILGRGLHTYAQLFWREHSAPPETYFVYSHDIYLDLLSGAGLVGFAAFAWLMFELGRTLWKRFTSATDPLDRAGLIGVMAALAAFGVHGFFDSVHHTVPTCLWTLCVLVAAVVPFPGSDDDQRPRWLSRSSSSVHPQRKKRLQQRLRCRLLQVQDYSLLSTLLLSLLALLSFYNVYLLTPLFDGAAAANNGEWSAAAPLLDEAARRDPTLALIPQQQGLVAAVLASKGDAAALDSAIAGFERAARMDPAWNANFANLGALYEARADASASGREDLTRAAAAFQQAVTLAPDAYLWHANLGAVREKLGDAEAAQAEYTQVLELHPAIASSSFWAQTALRQSTLGAWQAAHPAQPVLSLTELEAVLADNPDSIDVYLDLARAELAANRFGEADHTLKVAELTTIMDESQRLDMYALEAQSAAALGDSDRAAERQSMADQGYEVQGLYGPGTFGQGIYGPLVYRRPAITLELVPQMTLFSK